MNVKDLMDEATELINRFAEGLTTEQECVANITVVVANAYLMGRNITTEKGGETSQSAS